MSWWLCCLELAQSLKTHTLESYNDYILCLPRAAHFLFVSSAIFIKNIIGIHGKSYNPLSIRNIVVIQPTINMSGIQINNEAAGQFSNLRRRTFGIECEFIGLTPKNISDPEDATKYACKMLQEKVDLPCKNKCQQGSHQWYLPVRDTVAQGKATTGYTFSAWEVQHDVSISLDDDEYETYLSVADRTDVAQVELVSRVLNLLCLPTILKISHTSIWSLCQSQ